MYVNNSQPAKMNADTFEPKSLGTLTLWGLERVSASRGRRELASQGQERLRELGGLSSTTTISRDPIKEARRTNLLRFLIKNAIPEKMGKQIAQGVSLGKISSYDGLWVLQSITNELCNASARTWAERAQEEGLTHGESDDKDETGLWIGYGATSSAENLNPELQGIRVEHSSDNPFNDCATTSEVEGHFKAWYNHYLPYLNALASICVAGKDVMLYGEYSRWQESVTGLEQVIETFEDRAAWWLERFNSVSSAIAGEKDNINWDGFKL